MTELWLWEEGFAGTFLIYTYLVLLVFSTYSYLLTYFYFINLSAHDSTLILNALNNFWFAGNRCRIAISHKGGKYLNAMAFMSADVWYFLRYLHNVATKSLL